MSLKKFIGTKSFYKAVGIIVLPIILQNALNNIVNLLDNVMVGSLGSEQMSGVGIINQLIFVFSLCIFGGTAGAGIFTAQYYGNNDLDGIKRTVVFKIYISIIICIVCGLIIFLFRDSLINIFIHQNESDTVDPELTMEFAKEYLKIAIFAQIPNAVTQIYASTLRETGETRVPMFASLISVIINGILNAIFIFGLIGFPALGVKGAAIATLIARIAECLFILLFSHIKSKKFPYFNGLLSHLKIPAPLLKKLTERSINLLFNESLWSISQTAILYCYSLRGMDTFTAMNITNTFHELFCIVFLSLGNAIGIMVGNLLGAGKIEEAKDTDNKILFLGIILSIVMGIFVAACSPIVLIIYAKESIQIRELAIQFLLIVALFMPLHSLIHSCYFTLRAGGQTFITFLFDSIYSSVVSFSVAFLLARFTDISAQWLFFSVLSLDILKGIIGIILLKKDIWLKDLVKDDKKTTTENIADFSLNSENEDENLQDEMTACSNLSANDNIQTTDKI